MMFQGLLSLLLLLLPAGGIFRTAGIVASHQPPQAASPIQVIPADTLITLERTECYGPCPTYTLRILADGTVIFEGKENVKTKGRAEGKISREKVGQLISAFEKANYFSLRDKYRDHEDGCEISAFDNPSVTTSLSINGKSKSIFHYYGCRRLDADRHPVEKIFPVELTELETKIDELAGTKRWIDK